MKRAGQLAARVLRSLEIVGRDVDHAVRDVAESLWPGLPDGAVEAGSFRRGVLRVVVDDHARMAEAKGFFADEFHRLLNVSLERAGPERAASLERWGERGAAYVTRVVFHVRGTEP